MDSFSGQIEEYLHEEDALMDFLKHQASYCDVIKYENLVIYWKFPSFFLSNKNRSVVEKHEQLLEDNTKQETTLGNKRTQRDAYVCEDSLFIYLLDWLVH